MTATLDTPTTTPSPTTERVPSTGTLGGHRVSFSSVLAEDTAGRARRPVQTVTLTIPVSHDDITAVLWWLTETGTTLDELTDPATAAFYICEALAHEPTHTFTVARRRLARLRPGTAGHGFYLQLRPLVDALIGSRPATAGARS